MSDSLPSYCLPSNGRVYAIAAVVVLALLACAYCAGSDHGARKTTVAAIAAHRDTVIDTIRVTEKRLVVDTQHVRVTHTVAVAKQAAFDSAAHAVETLADTNPTASIAMALPAIHVCNDALAAKDSAYAALQVTVADLTTHDRAETQRADDDEREMKVMKPPRFGFRAGLFTGIAALAAVIHFVR